MPTKAQSHTTTNHAEMRRWTESRGAKPSCLKGMGDKHDIGILRLDFPAIAANGVRVNAVAPSPVWILQDGSHDAVSAGEITSVDFHPRSASQCRMTEYDFPVSPGRSWRSEFSAPVD